MHSDTSSTLRTLDELIYTYHQTVGHNTVLELGKLSLSLSLSLSISLSLYLSLSVFL